MTNYLMRKELQLAVSEEQVREHLVGYCTSLGFRLTSRDFPLRFRRGSSLGTLASTSPKKWEAQLVATIHTARSGGVVVVLEEEVNLTGQLFNKKEKEYLAREFDDVFASPHFGRSVPGGVHQGTGFAEDISKMERQFKGGANWFFWIAGFSVLNSLIFRFGGTTSFLAGLGATQLIDGIASGIYAVLDPSMRPLTIVAAIGANLLVAAYYVALGIFARRRSRLSFALGLLSYTIDALIFLPVHDFWSFGFHIFVAIFLLAGMNGLHRLNELENARPAAG